jgi:hypothetical protein
VSAQRKPSTRRLSVERLEDRTLLSSYAFTKIADSGDGLGNFGPAPALNNNGAVAFLASPPATQSPPCLYTGDGGDLTTIYCVTANTEQLGQFPSINDNGTVAFFVSAGRTQHIVIGDGQFTTVLYTAPQGIFASLYSPSLNNDTEVAFRAMTPILSNPEGVFDGDGETTVRVDSSGPFNSQFGSFPALNNVGQVAYEKLSFRSEDAINVGDGQTITTLYHSGGLFRNFGNPALNDTGTVAFFATTNLRQGFKGSGIFEGDGGPATIIALSGPVFSSFENAPAINNYGEVAFAATLSAGGSGVFTGGDPANDKVIATGDELDGATVTEVHLFRQGLNDNGQVAFFARLDDGTSGIFRADPVRCAAGRPGRAGPGGAPVVFVPSVPGLGLVGSAGAVAPQQPVPETFPGSSAPAALTTFVVLSSATSPHAQDTMVAIPRVTRSGREPMERLSDTEIELLALVFLSWP